MASGQVFWLKKSQFPSESLSTMGVWAFRLGEVLNYMQKFQVKGDKDAALCAAVWVPPKWKVVMFQPQSFSHFEKTILILSLEPYTLYMSKFVGILILACPVRVPCPWSSQFGFTMVLCSKSHTSTLKLRPYHPAILASSFSSKCTSFPMFGCSPGSTFYCKWSSQDFGSFLS